MNTMNQGKEISIYLVPLYALFSSGFLSFPFYLIFTKKPCEVVIVIMGKYKQYSQHIKTNGLYFYLSVQFSSVQSLSPVWFFATPWITARQASLSITNSQSSLRLTSIESVMPSNHFILYRPFSFCLQSFLPSGSFQMSQVAKVLEFQL